MGTTAFSRFDREARETILRAGLWAHAGKANAIDVVHLVRALEPGSPPPGPAVAFWTPRAKHALEDSLLHSTRNGRARVGTGDLRNALPGESSSSVQANDGGASADAISPPVQDSTGYCIRERDLEFLTISAEQLSGWRRRAYPLGMSSITYAAFKDELRTALLRDGLSLAGCDMCLRGSAAEFFSGPHKLLPRTEQEVVACYLDLRERTPEQWELEEAVDRLDRRWLADGIGPSRRPFDSMYQLGIAQYRSDLDVQLSSDELVARCVKILEREGRGLEGLTVENPQYKFTRPYLVDKAAPSLYLFSRRMTDRLGGRYVSIKVFPSGGPTTTSEPLSLDSRETDWKIDLSPTQPEDPTA